MYVWETGNPSGEIILFLHGGGIGGWMWRKQTEFFADYHCLVPDLPCHGKSKCPSAFRIDGCSTELINMLDKIPATEFPRKKVNLIGFSLGAQIALDLLARRPDLFSRAVIISALVRPLKNLKRLFLIMAPLSYLLMRNRTFQKFQANSSGLYRDYFEEYYQSVKMLNTRILKQIYAENMSFAIPPNYPEVEVPTLIIAGEKEPQVMIKSAEDLVNSNKNSQGMLIPQIGHGYSLLLPDEFNRVTESWLKTGEIPAGTLLIQFPGGNI